MATVIYRTDKLTFLHIYRLYSHIKKRITVLVVSYYGIAVTSKVSSRTQLSQKVVRLYYGT